MDNLSRRALLQVKIFKKRAPLWCEAHFEVKMLKAPPVRNTFGSEAVEKVRAVVGRSAIKVNMQLKDRITPHVTNFSRLRLGIEKQEGKRKYKSDGAVMVGEFVCVCVCSSTVSE